MRRILHLIVAILLFTVYAGAGTDEKVRNFTLKDVHGTEHSLRDYEKAKAIVLMFIATQCPVSNAYNERMVKLYEEYRDKDIVFLGINSNRQESVEEIVRHAEEHGLDFPILKDHNNVVADALEASVTPEIYVLSGSLELQYHGRIDDSQREANVKHQDLRTVLDELLSGKDISVTRTKAFGCTIKRVS